MKTPQEAAREYMQNVLNDSDLSVNYEEDNYDAGVMHTLTEALEPAFLAGDAFGYSRGMEKAYRWISVEDELPEPGEPYDEKYYSVKCPLFSESGYAFAEFGRDGCWVEDSTGRDITQYVTHWRPIERVKE